MEIGKILLMVTILTLVLFGIATGKKDRWWNIFFLFVLLLCQATLSTERVNHSKNLKIKVNVMINKPVLYWKVGDKYYEDYEEALSMVGLCNRDLQENGIEKDWYGLVVIRNVGLC